MALKMTDETLEHTVKRTDFVVPGAAAGTYFSGDHLNALCRAIARRRLRGVVRLGVQRLHQVVSHVAHRVLPQWQPFTQDCCASFSWQPHP